MQIEPSSFREEIDQTSTRADSTRAIAGGDPVSASGDECDDHARGQERTGVDPSALDEPGPDASLAPPSVIAFSSDSITEGHIKRSALRILLRLAACAQFFRSADGRFFAQVPVGDRLEIFGLRSAAFRDWLVDGYVNSQPEAPSDWAVRRATSVLEARARFQTRVPEIFVRVGRSSIGDDDAYFLDLGDPSGAARARSSRHGSERATATARAGAGSELQADRPPTSRRHESRSRPRWDRPGRESRHRRRRQRRSGRRARRPRGWTY